VKRETGEDLEDRNQSLKSIFQAIENALRKNQEALNRCDQEEGVHGDQMVQIFTIATDAVARLNRDDLPGAMSAAAEQLVGSGDNRLSLTYAHGLETMAKQLYKNRVTLDDLILAINKSLEQKNLGDKGSLVSKNSTPDGLIIKSLLAGLSNWNQIEDGHQVSEKPLDFSALIGIGMAYMQAKQRNQDRLDTLADAAASASPLGRNECTFRSGKIVIQAILQSIQQSQVADT